MKQEIKERIEKIQKGEVPEGYRKTKVGIIPIAWGVVPTNKVLKTVKRAVNVELNAEYREIGIRSHGKGIFHKKLVQGNKLGNKRVFWVEEKCFIVNIVFAWEQAVAKTSENERGLIASHRFPMYKPKNDLISLDYLLAFYQSPRGKCQLNLASPGGAGRNKTLGQKEFAQSLIPLPKIDEQQKIAEILSTWDKAIELKEKLIKEKKESKRWLMQKLFTREIRFSGFNDEWDEKKIGIICEIKKGIQINKTELSFKGKYAVLNGGISPSGYTTEWNTKENTITISEGGNSCGFVNFNKDKIWCGGHCYALSNVKINNLLLYYILKYVEKKIMQLRVGSGLPNIQKQDVINFRLPIPNNVKEQEKIAQILDLISIEIMTLINELKQLKEQKRGLMQLLLTGIVRVEVD